MLLLLALLLAIGQANAILVLFSTLVTQGNVGYRPSADALCQVWDLCPAPRSLLTYSNDSIHDLELTFTQDTPLFSSIATELGFNGTYSLWNGEAVASIVNIATMLGADTNSVHWFAGYQTDGTETGNNCQDWTSNSPTDFGTQWPMGVDVSCDNLFQIPCVCDFGARRLSVKQIRNLFVAAANRRLSKAGPLIVTGSPTHKPTSTSPTHKPTTNGPTHRPTLAPTLSAADQVKYALLMKQYQDYTDRADYDLLGGNLQDPGNVRDTMLYNSAAEYTQAADYLAQAQAL